jgi:hypothetical protein
LAFFACLVFAERNSSWYWRSSAFCKAKAIQPFMTFHEVPFCRESALQFDRFWTNHHV